ncbi:hypothetical protein GOV07_02075 [Candidatus Woesearchaeota archaeon]|nr:hypothetical protein [Candidatus Woesearchaeota archaeon]
MTPNGGAFLMKDFPAQELQRPISWARKQTRIFPRNAFGEWWCARHFDISLKVLGVSRDRREELALPVREGFINAREWGDPNQEVYTWGLRVNRLYFFALNSDREHGIDTGEIDYQELYQTHNRKWGNTIVKELTDGSLYTCPEHFVDLLMVVNLDGEFVPGSVYFPKEDVA